MSLAIGHEVEGYGYDLAHKEVMQGAFALVRGVEQAQEHGTGAQALGIAGRDGGQVYHNI